MRADIFVPRDDDCLLEKLLVKHKSDWWQVLTALVDECQDVPYASRMPTLDTVAAECLRLKLIDQATFAQIHEGVVSIMQTLEDTK